MKKSCADVVLLKTFFWAINCSNDRRLYASFWTSSGGGASAIRYYVFFNASEIKRQESSIRYGFSVRCLKQRKENLGKKQGDEEL